MIPRTFEQFKEQLSTRADVLRKHGILDFKKTFNLYIPGKASNPTGRTGKFNRVKPIRAIRLPGDEEDI